MCPNVILFIIFPQFAFVFLKNKNIPLFPPPQEVETQKKNWDIIL